MHHQVFVLPTERWIGPSLIVPYMGTVSRETHTNSVVMCRADQARYLTGNFFARYCDEMGQPVNTEAEATVGTTDTFAKPFHSDELPSATEAAELEDLDEIAAADRSADDATAKIETTEVGDPNATEAGTKEAGDSAAKSTKKEPVKK
jgi:hypothetical protein